MNDICVSLGFERHEWWWNATDGDAGGSCCDWVCMVVAAAEIW